jgi:biopolymer transport protein ExbD
MNFRKHLANEPMVLQLAPFIDVILFLLTFFLLTWNISRYEADLSVRLPVAKDSEVSKNMPGEVLVNVRKDGAIVINNQTLTSEELRSILSRLTADFPDQAVILRADAEVKYQSVIGVIDVCKAAKVWNIAFVTAVPDKIRQ